MCRSAGLFWRLLSTFIPCWHSTKSLIRRVAFTCCWRQSASVCCTWTTVSTSCSTASLGESFVLSWRSALSPQTPINLAGRTNGRAYATCCVRLSSTTVLCASRRISLFLLLRCISGITLDLRNSHTWFSAYGYMAASCYLLQCFFRRMTSGLILSRCHSMMLKRCCLLAFLTVFFYLLFLCFSPSHST